VLLLESCDVDRQLLKLDTALHFLHVLKLLHVRFILNQSRWYLSISFMIMMLVIVAADVLVVCFFGFFRYLDIEFVSFSDFNLVVKLFAESLFSYFFVLFNLLIAKLFLII